MVDITTLVQDAAAKLAERFMQAKTEFLREEGANPETHGIVLIHHSEAGCLVETMILVPREELEKQSIDIDWLLKACPCRTIRIPIGIS